MIPLIVELCQEPNREFFQRKTINVKIVIFFKLNHVSMLFIFNIIFCCLFGYVALLAISAVRQNRFVRVN